MVKDAALTGQVEIEIKRFEALSPAQLHACLKLRGEVFVVGQQICQVPDVDEHDPDAYHLMMWLDHELVGTARLLPKDNEQVIKVGRVAVSAHWRGRGLGGEMMRAVQAWISEQPGVTGVMDAQAHLVDWYTALGWQRVGEPFMEAGLKHVEMRYTPENAV